MLNTVKYAARQLAALLRSHKIRNVVVSPGTRDAPLIMALARTRGLKLYSVIDERSAAFIALGMACISGTPTVLICTSGTAVLNYAPAVAEAYYRHVPLIVVSADRPAQWIDQDDSQTIRQIGVLHSIVKASYAVGAETDTPDLQWMANRTINNALSKAVAFPPGPVHLNIAFDEPVGAETEVNEPAPRHIEVIQPTQTLTVAEYRSLASDLRPYAKVLILCGYQAPNAGITKALCKLSALPNVVVMTEAQTNAHCPRAINCIDATLSALDKAQLKQLAPEVVITFGGSLLSRMVKALLRETPIKQHWHVGVTRDAIDNFRCLTRRIEIEPSLFLPQMASAMQIYASSKSTFARQWANAYNEALLAKECYTEQAPWSDLTAMHEVMTTLPSKVNLQLSNGTAVRYAQLFDCCRLHRVDCNRGVSGIDGCTSTTIGAATQYKGLTVLITGDMSAQYDIGALGCSFIPSRLRIIVLNNGGGGIFRFINNTASLPEMSAYMACDVRLPLQLLAEAYGMDYYEARNIASLQEALPWVLDEHAPRPIILNIVTPGQESADILRGYFAVKC